MAQADDFLGQRQRRLENLQKLKDLGVDPYPAKAHKQLSNEDIIKKFQELEGKEVTVAGRLISFRDHGKLIFADLLDQSGKVQLCLKQDEFSGDLSQSEIPWEYLKLIDEGDFIETKGMIGKTQQDQITVFSKKIRLLSKSLRPLPARFEDKEHQFRRRYLDLILNRHHLKIFNRKSKFWQVQREFMGKKGFMEIETPILEHVTGGADAQPFTTHHNELNQSFFLRISTELYQKRLIGAGLEKIFTLGPNFRNEGISDEHLQEYYQLEWYWAYVDYRDNMKLVTELVREIGQQVYGKTKFTARGHTFDLSDDWLEIDYVSIIKQKFGIDIFTASAQEMMAVIKKHGVDLTGTINKNRLIDNLWKIIRKTIAGPAFLVHIPKFLSPLAKSVPEHPELTERFQVILAGSELGNGYTEINDPQDQLARFLEQQNLRDLGDEEAQMLDIDYVEMLEWGMPPTSGYGQSERLFWFLENITGREGTLFPQLRRETDELTKKIYPGIFKKNSSPLKKNLANKATETSRIDQTVRTIAFEIVDSHISNKNLVKHCLAVEAAMRGLARHFGEDENVWGLAGLLHDADWEHHRERPDLHTRETVKWMEEKNMADAEVVRAILSHNHEHNKEKPPESKMEWALYTCDELTGIVVATALIMPTKQLADVTSDSVMKKFKTPSFAAAVDRNQIKLAEFKLGLPLDQFIAIVLSSMKTISADLGL